MHIGYIRVSTKEQSTARQLEGIHLDIPPFEDKISGVLKDRPKLNECLLVLRKGDTLHVHSMCRLARNLRHLEEIVTDLMTKGVDVHFHKEGLIFKGDQSNTFSMMMLQIIGSVAQFERTNSKERQAEGTLIAKQKGTKSGKPWGKPPLDMTRRNEALKLRSEGMSNRMIALEMKLSRPSITKLLS